MQQRTDSQKMAALLHVAGVHAIKVYNTFTFESPEVRDYATVIKKFEECCMPKVNEIYERYVFRNCMQEEREPIEKYVVRLKDKAQSCNYGNLKDSIIRDQIVCGLIDKRMRERLLREDNLSLDKAIQMCQASETTERQLRIFETHKGNGHVDAVLVSKPKQYTHLKADGRQGTAKQKVMESGDFLCRFCKQKHVKGKCPAYGKFCSKCKKRNHFAVACLSKK